MGTRCDADEVYRIISPNHIYAVKKIIRILALLTFAYVLWRNSYSAASILLLVGLLVGYDVFHFYTQAWYRVVCFVIYGAFGLQLLFPERMKRLFSGSAQIF